MKLLLPPRTLRRLWAVVRAAVGAAVAKPAHRSRLNHWTRNWNRESLRHSSWTPTPLAPCGDSPPSAARPAGTQHVGRDGGNDGDDGDAGGGFGQGKHMPGAWVGICGYALDIGPFGWMLDGVARASDLAVARPRLG